MSDPPFSDIDFKNKMARVWTTLNSRQHNDLSNITNIDDIGQNDARIQKGSLKSLLYWNALQNQEERKRSNSFIVNHNLWFINHESLYDSFISKMVIIPSTYEAISLWDVENSGNIALSDSTPRQTITKIHIYFGRIN